MENEILKSWKKTYRPEFIKSYWMKRCGFPLFLDSDHMQEIVKIMAKPLIASLVEKGIDLKPQAFGTEVAS